MTLQGIHHITAITGNAPGNVDFYARVLGLRLVKKTVNFDAPDVYHLYFADEKGAPGSVLTFFEFPGASPGRHGSGMIHTVIWGVAAPEALDFWEERLTGEGIDVARLDGRLALLDPEGLGIEIALDAPDQARLAARWQGIPPEFALTGFSGVRAYRQTATADTLRMAAAGHRSMDTGHVLTGVMGFDEAGPGAYEVSAGARTATYTLDDPPQLRGFQGAGSVHHIAWACDSDAQADWRQRLIAGHLSVTPIIDRQYFRSIYYREPGGVLFEIATLGPGFAIDEPPDRLGEELKLPPQHEPMREQLERSLTPLVNPRVDNPESEQPSGADE